MNRVLSLVALLALALPLASQVEPELKSGDLKKLGKHFGLWVEAKIDQDSSAASKAMIDLEGVLGKMKKKLKGRSPLALVRDWEIVFDTGRKFSTSGRLFRKGKILELEIASFGSKYLVWLPPSYKPAKASYPTMLLLDSDPAATMESLPKDVLAAFIILAPLVGDLEASKLMQTEGRSLMLAPIGEGTRRYHIDRRRLFLVGKGERGIAFATAYASILPHYFAGLATVGAGLADVPAKRNLSLIPVEEKSSIAEAAEWMLGLEPSDHYPTSFEMDLVEPWMGRAYWVQALQFDTGEALPEGKVARLKISVDRGTNTITIDGEYVYQVMLFLNDILVDLDKPITVMRNGQSYSFQTSRSLGTLLEAFANNLDGAVFPAKLRQLDLPSEAKESTDG